MKHNNKIAAADTLLLDTGLFNDHETLRAALKLASSTGNTSGRVINLDCMNDSDWDEILDLVLSVKRVITV